MANESNVLPNTLIPVVLSGQLAQIVGQNVAADIVIDGLPFMLKPSQEYPYVREADEDRKEQFDTSREAGENSFGLWWLRSQHTFHGGQGQKFLDSGDTEIARTRFFSSRYADVHTAGEVTIAGTITSAANTRKGAEIVTWSNVQKLVTMSTSTFQIHVADLPGLTGATTINLGATGVPTAITSDGENIWVAIADKIYRVNSAGTATHTHNLTFTGTVALGFAKQRLIACVGNKVYELDPNPAAPPVAPAVHYTNPSTGYVYTSVSEGPDGIYLTGYSGPRSDLSRMSVVESGGTIVLGPPILQFPFPPGELAKSAYFYVSSFFAVATTAGVRVGTFTPYAQPQVGPLIIEGTSCHSLTGSGTRIWVGANDSIWWVDLSTPIDQVGGYSHSLVANGLGSSSTDAVNDVVVHPGTNDLVFGTTASGRLISQTTFTAATEAALTTSWARFDTVEPKQLHYISVDGDDPEGTVVVEASSGDTLSLTMDGTRCCYEFATTTIPVAQAFRLNFTLTGGTLRSYQMKALPAARRFKDVILPLALYDRETPVQGPPLGFKGFAKERLAVLEALAEANERITVVDNLLNVTYQAVIRRLQFIQDLAPTPENGLGGIVNVALRLV